MRETIKGLEILSLWPEKLNFLADLLKLLMLKIKKDFAKKSYFDLSQV